MILTMIVLAAVITLFIFEWVRVDVVGIMMMVMLPLIGLISPAEAFVGLSSNAVCSIIAVIIIGAGLDKTGIMNQVAGPIIRLAGKSEKKIIILVSATVGLISSMMQNIGAAALFLPATQRISKRMGIPLSRILMPMGFCAIIGGTITLVGASPTILLNDLMVLGGKKLEPFGFVLPAASGEADKDVTSSLMEAYQLFDNIYELHIPQNFNPAKTLEELEIRTKYLTTVIAIHHSAENVKNFAPRSSDRVAANDDIAVVGREQNVHWMAEKLGWQIKDGLEVFAESLARTNSGLAESVVPPRSELIGKTMSELNFKEQYKLNPIALIRANRVYYGGLTRIPLQMGDTILLQGPWERFHVLRNRSRPRAL
ncbi:MAG: SLC13 family permease, partial [Deltaproteobacteria bacterium]|nr:SLC13 family permease [Deltaproteobacteria bacterium]